VDAENDMSFTSRTPTYLTPEQRHELSQIPADLTDRDLARDYTLTSQEVELVNRRRRPSNRLSFVVQLALIPPLLNRRTKIYPWLLPINKMLREEIGSHHIGNLLSMNAQPLIKSFQMLHRGKSNLEQSAVAPTEFMDL
jgi:hypothetical protein